ncbi:Amino-acid acetyltransferase, mitochondrial [Blastocladiella emersonii ATCC 22665]|nr:Amino-acid acetyltransferase, mitochondrial [Blastocladiella emersonii ATCC 22665]
MAARILEAGPSPREAASYLRRYDLKRPPPTADDPGTLAAPTTAAAAIQAQAGGPSLTPSHAPPIHIALVQLQWPLPAHHAAQVAADLVALQRLAVNPVLVVDVDPPVPAASVDTEEGRSTRVPDLAARDPRAFRTAQLDACGHVARYLHAAGTPARPVASGVYHLLDGEDPATDLSPDPADLPLHIDLAPLQACLTRGTVPVLAPLAQTWHGSRYSALPLSRAVPALAARLAATPQHARLSATDPRALARAAHDPDRAFVRRCLPSKLIVVNRRGGLPGPTPFVNLAQDREVLDAALEGADGARDDLAQAHRVLAVLPPSATAVIAAAESSRAVVSHYLTDKPLVAVSLPTRGSAAAAVADAGPVPPTVLRLGVPLRVAQSMRDVDSAKLARLLESSFGRRLDRAAFFARLEHQLSAVIIAGDYVGAAIVTTEGEGIQYLDKFAVSPAVQSGGVADILWLTLRGEVAADHLVWRSRASNKVNPWYFARSDGMIKLPPPVEGGGAGKEPWTVFWYCGAGRAPDADRIDAYVAAASAVPASFV